MAGDDGWLTGPALDIIKSLRAILPGDEVMVKICENDDHAAYRDNYYCNVPATVLHVVQNPAPGAADRLFPLLIDVGYQPITTLGDTLQSRRAFCFCSVTHWRRPKR